MMLDEDLIEKLRNVALEIPEDNQTQINKRKKDLVAEDLKNIALCIKHDPRDHTKIPMDYI